MTGSVDRGTLDRLIALSRDRGELTANDLQAVLPIDSMDVDAIVLVMLELDAAGVSVEPEAFGLSRDQRVASGLELTTPAPGTLRSAEAIGEGGPPMIAVQPPHNALGEQAASRDAGERESIDRVVLLSGLVVFLVLGVVLLLL